MSLESEQVRKQYSANGVTTTFTFPWYFLDATDLDVYTVNATTGVPTKNAFVTDYDVTGLVDPLDSSNILFTDGGDVVFNVAPASGNIIVIVRNNPDTQDTSFTHNAGFGSAVVERALDKLAMMIQYLVMVAQRSARLPDSYAGSFDPTLPALPVAGQGLVADPTGTFLTWGVTTGTPVPSLNGSASSPQQVTAAGGVSLSSITYNNVAWVKGNGGPVSVTALASITIPTITGALLTLVGCDNTNTVTLKDETQLVGSKLQLNGMCILGLYNAITLIFDGTYWVEVSRR